MTLCMRARIDYQGSQGTSERCILISNIQYTGAKTHSDAQAFARNSFPAIKRTSTDHIKKDDPYGDGRFVIKHEKGCTILPLRVWKSCVK